MKGAVFTILENMVLEKFGLQAWDDILQAANPRSGGIYTAAETYCDEELFQLVGVASERLGIAAEDLVYGFGVFSLGEFARSYPELFADKTAKQLLLEVDSVIHVEVAKLYPGALTPSFEYEDPGPRELVMKYRSPRKLCKMAEGLIEGVARHYQQPIGVAHETCMHQHSDHCRLSLSFE